MSLRASLVMATLGRTVEIDRCVDSLAAQTRRDFELIVVDQNPDDRLVPVVARAAHWGWNAIIFASVSPICAWPAIPASSTPRAISCIPGRRLLVRGGCRREGAGPLRATGRTRWAGDSLVRDRRAPCRQVLFRGICPLARLACQQHYALLSWCQLARGGRIRCCTGLHSWYGAGEETDLMLRLLAAGAVVDFDPVILVHHAMATPLSFPPLKMFSSTRRRARGTGALYARHPLSAWVIVRGLLSPWPRALTQLTNPRKSRPETGAGTGQTRRLCGLSPWISDRQKEKRRMTTRSSSAHGAMPARRKAILATASTLLLGGLSAMGVGGMSSSRTISPSGHTIPREYFGMHIHRADSSTPWPGVRFGSWRLWDAYVSWPQLEPNRGQWDFKRLDKYVAMASLTGVNVLLPLGLSPAWASARPNEVSAYRYGNAAEPLNIEDWRSYVRAVAERYKDGFATTSSGTSLICGIFIPEAWRSCCVLRARPTPY